MEDFIQQSLVFIGAAVLLVPVFRYFGFGSILGYLIAGIIVGPYGLELISDSENIIHFAELGVVLLLFMIGLEIQPGKLWSMRKHLFGMGGLQIGLTTLVFAAVGMAVGLESTTSFILAFSLSLSSTAFAVQTLTEKNQLGTEYGRMSLAILLMQDLVAIPALAIIPALAGVVTMANNSWITLLQFGVVLTALILMSRYLVRPIFRIIVALRAREIFTAVTLFIVLGVAFLMQKLGLSAALGTFIAGVLLAESEYRHELEANLEPFKSLFMGLFFIGVGMTVSLPILFHQPMLVVGLALGYLAIKIAVIYGITRLFSIHHETGKRVALQIAQGGEFAFVILGILLSYQLANPEVVSVLTAMITLSMAVNPILTKVEERFFRPAPSDVSKARAYDLISDESPQVIIAGFGRFGQIFGRVMRAQNIPFVAIDHDSDQIELLRKFGNKVYYGDAARTDLLEAAGAAKAKYFVLAVDDVETSLEIARTVKAHFPNLTIFARARNRGHVFELMDIGVESIRRETFESSLYFTRDLLEKMGFPLESAKRIIKRFKEHDEAMIAEQYKVRHDDAMFVSLAKQGTEQLRQVLSSESSQSYINPDSSSLNSKMD